jgi:hypothetical protein
MSRGPGRLQQAIFHTLREHGKPMTWAEMRSEVCKQTGFDEALFSIVHNSLERSLRRAMAKMVKDGAVITIGHGGRADPFRYSIDPLLMGMIDAMIAKREHATMGDAA